MATLAKAREQALALGVMGGIWCAAFALGISGFNPLRAESPMERELREERAQLVVAKRQAAEVKEKLERLRKFRYAAEYEELREKA